MRSELKSADLGLGLLSLSGVANFATNHESVFNSGLLSCLFARFTSGHSSSSRGGSASLQGGTPLSEFDTVSTSGSTGLVGRKHSFSHATRSSSAFSPLGHSATVGHHASAAFSVSHAFGTSGSSSLFIGGKSGSPGSTSLSGAGLSGRTAFLASVAPSGGHQTLTACLVLHASCSPSVTSSPGGNTTASRHHTCFALWRRHALLSPGTNSLLDASTSGRDAFLGLAAFSVSGTSFKHLEVIAPALGALLAFGEPLGTSNSHLASPATLLLLLELERGGG